MIALKKILSQAGIFWSWNTGYTFSEAFIFQEHSLQRRNAHFQLLQRRLFGR